MIVQDLFKNCDCNLLLNSLCNLNSIYNLNINKFGKEIVLRNINNTVNNLLSVQPEISKDFIYVFKEEDIFDENENTFIASIVKRSDLEKNEKIIKTFYKDNDVSNYPIAKNPISYGLIFIELEKLLGYNFSEYSIKKYNKYDIMAILFNELTYFGNNKETYNLNLNKEKEELYKSINEMENSNEFLDFADVKKEISRRKNIEEPDENKFPSNQKIDEIFKRNLISECDQLYHLL